ncbi:PapB/FocB family fimbrial expression transcriptional regulator [Citrobacter werkmanii]|uniref:PapB/FocB family fimbrial expression transcriptional regulator n=1 Tax=Citrobacter werkmanii TaxID=67827 RepID=UPI00127FAB35|nr:fimbrial protein [Salmonella enterica]EAZ9261398.1 fimbrial protein [Salmonella enterica]EBN2521046.1 fimbrial protein [Salmonella enterica]
MEKNVEHIKTDGLQPLRSSFLEKKNHILSSRSMSADEFWCFIELTSIRSEKIIRALFDYFVSKQPRALCCERYGVSNGYFSACISRFEHVIQVVGQLFSYYETSGSNIE